MWVLGIPALLSLLLYPVLLITPMGSQAAQAVVSGMLPSSSQLTLGPMALENGVWPVIQFSSVLLSDSKSGAKVVVDAFEVGFSSVRALFGQPGTTATIVKPHVQVIQDLFGPRLSSFELVDDPQGGASTVRVQDRDDAFPVVAIGPDGIDLGKSAAPAGMRSDNDWLISNL
ncbi:MAG: hypothetical protein MO852_08625 [Candidatus Devosia euplotis]|nr:hypothetical protein [Candidatus Devosia euplotis]